MLIDFQHSASLILAASWLTDSISQFSSKHFVLILSLMDDLFKKRSSLFCAICASFICEFLATVKKRLEADADEILSYMASNGLVANQYCLQHILILPTNWLSNWNWSWEYSHHRILIWRLSCGEINTQNQAGYWVYGSQRNLQNH